MPLVLIFLLAIDPFRPALPGYQYHFPRDHFNHPEFKTEWWYYTGNLHDRAGRKFGFELTFFRQGLDRKNETAGVWDVRDGWMAHLALSDIDGGRFFHAERLNRSGAGLAGSDLAQAMVWNGNWSSRWDLATGRQTLRAVDPRFSFELELDPAKPPVVHGVNGVSQKSEGAGQASHYVSFTRLATRGVLSVSDQRFEVEGLSWMDHEFFSHELAGDQSGWDWFSLQFDDNTELMLYRMRRTDGSADRFSSGTFVDAAGRATHLTREMFELTPGRKWGGYPVEWRVSVPSLGIDVTVHTRLPQQELTGRTSYWEGAVEITGSRRGAGYLEMTGYRAKLKL